MAKKSTHKPDFINSEELTKNLKTEIIGKKIYFFEKIPSTNLYAKQLIKECAQEGTIVIADIQTSGRGRKNRIWYSPPGGLWLSVILYPEICPKSGMLITMTVSISVAQAIKEITGLDPEIKWPNDLLLKEKKICGILTEINADFNKIKYAIVGIGINVNNEIDEDLKNIAFSLKQELGSEVSRIKLLSSILKNLDNNYKKLIQKNYNYIEKTWISFTKMIDRKVQITDEKNVIVGIVKDIDENGHLIIESKFGEMKIVSGDIKYL
ncbi:MAG: biotin--[acetyl-CoA-carboxylase] ligase [Thermoplasmatales archaeon]|nr:MAG: biotin--[acetyl-CoA-carboxylase] ligase [Thermoplasmatales archaeon]